MSAPAGRIPVPAIRGATAADVEDIHRLIVELAAATGKAHLVRSAPGDFLRFGFEGRPAFQALIAEHRGRIAGLSLYFYNFSSWRGELGVYIQDLVVAADARGLGLGRELMRETARRARADGATHLRLAVDKSNAGAIGFYRGLGLERSDDECIFQARGPAFRALAE